LRLFGFGGIIGGIGDKMIFYEEILKAFQKQKVKYIVVGGTAVNLLGSMRSTFDLDILVEMSDDNLKKIVKIMKRYDCHVEQSFDPIKIADKKNKGKFKISVDNVCTLWYTYSRKEGVKNEPGYPQR
jgi:predicted nucleotidyltransferase